MKDVHGKKIWLFSAISDMVNRHKVFSPGDTVDIQIMRAGKWKHSEYGDVVITEEDIEEFKRNFDENKRGVELVVDENHEDDHKALGIFRKLYTQGRDALFATIELTRQGAEVLTKGLYQYFSPEFFRSYKDEETGETIRNLLVGGAFTNRPFFKLMSPLMASEDGANLDKSESAIFIFSDFKNMNRILELLEKFSEKGTITQKEQEELKQLFGALPEDEKKAVSARVTSALKFTEEDGDGEEGGEDDEEDKGKEEEQDDEEDEDDDEEDDEESDEGDGGEKSQQHKEVTIKASELDRLKRIEETSVRNAIESRVAKYSFNDSVGTGSIMPAAIGAAKEFALMLSERQRKAFFAFLKKNRVTTSLFSEVGHSKENDEAGLTDEEKLDKRVEAYMEKHNVDYAVAIRVVGAGQ